MANKKLTKTEIKALANKILREANEIIVKNNEASRSTKKYLDEKAAIESKFGFYEAKARMEKELKIALGKAAEEFEFSLYAKSGTKSRTQQEEINKELNQLSLKYIKKQLNENDLELIEEEITIAQIDCTDIALLINSIKTRLTT